MINRYSKRNKLYNSLEMYEKVFRDRNLKFVRQYSTPKFDFPSVQEMKKINTVSHIWAVGDRYYKLAAKHYGDSKDWWVIALFNNKPTESDIMIGEEILIPTPLTTIIQYLKY